MVGIPTGNRIFRPTWRANHRSLSNWEFPPTVPRSDSPGSMVRLGCLALVRVVLHHRQRFARFGGGWWGRRTDGAVLVSRMLVFPLASTVGSGTCPLPGAPNRRPTAL